MSKTDMLTIQQVDSKFQKACCQLKKLNRIMDEQQLRFVRAENNGQQSFRYNQRIRLCVLEGVKDMYYEYAYRLAQKLDDMRKAAGYIIITDEDEEWSDTDNIH